MDRAEREPELAHPLDEAPGVMAEEAARRNTLVVHYSTDYVFDGKTTTPYTETDRPNPINEYGASETSRRARRGCRRSAPDHPDELGLLANRGRDSWPRSSAIFASVNRFAWFPIRWDRRRGAYHSRRRPPRPMLEALRVDDGFHLHRAECRPVSRRWQQCGKLESRLLITS